MLGCKVMLRGDNPMNTQGIAQGIYAPLSPKAVRAQPRQIGISQWLLQDLPPAAAIGESRLAPAACKRRL